MTLKRIMTGAFAAGAMTLAALGPATAQTRGVTDDEIIIGTHLDLSGPTAAAMGPLKTGIEMAFDDINANGGIHGRNLRLVVEDNAYQPKQAVRAVQSLITKENAFLIFSPFGTGTSAAGYAVAAKMNTPHVFPYTGVPSIFHPEGSTGSFTYIADYARATSTGLDWLIKELGSKRVGVLYQDDAFGKLVLEGVEQALAANGLELIETAGYKPGDVDFSAQVTKLNAADVDLVVLGTVVRETIGSYMTIRKMGWDVDVVTTTPGRTDIVPLLAKGGLDGLYGIGSWNIPGSGEDSEEAAAWLERFTAANPGMAPEAASVAYLMAHWMAQGLEAAGPDLTVEGFNAAMEGSTYKDIFGHPEMTLVNGHISPEVTSLWVAEGETWRKISDDIVK